MINVTVRKHDGSYKGIEISGHAGFAKRGKDIVCSAVSILVLNTVNSIENFTDDDITIQSEKNGGYVRLTFNAAPSHDAALLLDCMVFGLGQIADEYDSRYLNLVTEEE